MKEHNDRVAIARSTLADYPLDRPFHPPRRYPEYPFQRHRLDPKNHVYSAVRELFRLLGLDAERYGRADWNPLGEFIQPGDRVVVKPNFVLDYHWQNGNIDGLITHGSILRAVIDYVIIASGGVGHIVVADAPLGMADFRRILSLTGLSDVVAFYKTRGIDVRPVDLRARSVEYRHHLSVGERELSGDPSGYLAVDLGTESEFRSVSRFSKRFRGTDFEMENLRLHHNETVNEYYVSKTILDADVIINVPKLKTHTKAGVTLSLKNMVGINGDKNWLPHFRLGGLLRNGDEFPGHSIFREVESALKDRLKRNIPQLGPMGLFWARNIRTLQKKIVDKTGLTKVRGGCWYGNDTVWRMILDLNKILLYADKDGRLSEGKKRKYFSLIDGIVAGEGNGPLYPRAKFCGVLIGGFDPLAVDRCAIRLMGFDHRKIPLMANANGNGKYRFSKLVPGSAKVVSNVLEWDDLLSNRAVRDLQFQPPDSWRGHIEMDPEEG